MRQSHFDLASALVPNAVERIFAYMTYCACNRGNEIDRWNHHVQNEGLTYQASEITCVLFKYTSRKFHGANVRRVTLWNRHDWVPYYCIAIQRLLVELSYSGPGANAIRGVQSMLDQSSANHT